MYHRKSFKYSLIILDEIITVLRQARLEGIGIASMKDAAKVIDTATGPETAHEIEAATVLEIGPETNLVTDPETDLDRAMININEGSTSLDLFSIFKIIQII